MRSGDVAEGTCGGRDGMRGVSGKGGTRASPTTAAWGRCALSWARPGRGGPPRGRRAQALWAWSKAAPRLHCSLVAATLPSLCASASCHVKLEPSSLLSVPRGGSDSTRGLVAFLLSGAGRDRQAFFGLGRSRWRSAVPVETCGRLGLQGWSPGRSRKP